MENSDSRYRTNSPTVVYEVIDGEAVIVNMENGSYYSIDDSGALIWDLINQGLSSDAICNSLAGKYTGSIEEINAAVSGLIEKFLEEQLILKTGEAGDNKTPIAAASHETDKIPFRAPELRKYTDMEELLLLDPVHEETDDESSSEDG